MLDRPRQRAQREQKSEAHTRRLLARVHHLFSIQPVREIVLPCISAYDAAKLDMLRLLVLTDAERRKYLEPARDVVWDVQRWKRCRNKA